MSNHNHSVEVGSKVTQQIAGWAGLFGTIAAVMLASNSPGTNMLVVGFIAFAASTVVSLASRGFGVCIILVSCLMILAKCSAS